VRHVTTHGAVVSWAVVWLSLCVIGGRAEAQAGPGGKAEARGLVPSALWRVFTAYPTQAGACKIAVRDVADRAVQGALLVGVAEGVEVRLTRVNPDRGASLSTVGAKLQLVKPERGTPAVTLGLEDILEETKVGRAYYLVASHPIPDTELRLHGGLWVDDRKSGLLLGAEAAVPTLSRHGHHRTVVLADYNRDSVNSGVRLFFPRARALLELAVFDVGGRNELAIGARHMFIP